MEEQIYDFVVSLNFKYDQIRVQMLTQAPFPTSREAYALVQQEESRCSAMVRYSSQDCFALYVTPNPRECKAS